MTDVHQEVSSATHKNAHGRKAAQMQRMWHGKTLKYISFSIWFIFIFHPLEFYL